MATPEAKAGLHRAIENDELVLFYQPIHELESRRIVSAEALLRAQRPNGEIRNASKLAEAAEEGEDLHRLDSWLVRTAYRQAAHWQRELAPDVHININLSPREFQERDLTKRLETLLSGCGVDPHNVNLEITETHFISKADRVLDVLADLKRRGMNLWLDDFGTGHSSIWHLQHFPVDGVKVPGAFVKDLPDDRRCRAIASSIIALAHELELKVVAEEIETEEQLAFLRDCGCDYIQGYLFSKPMPAAAFEELLREQARSR